MDDDSIATPGAPAPEATGHRPVLLHPLIESLQPRPGLTYIDGTLGAGGYVAAFLERLRPGGRILAIDRDPAAVASARRRFRADAGTVIVEHGDFADMASIAAAHNVTAVDGVVLDLGISSLQLDDPARGFSFRFDGPLDMRMDGNSDVPASDLVQQWSQADLTALIRTYGEERFAPSIAAAIVRRRSEEPITTTAQLREIVERTIPRRFWPKRIHPATRTFQALRIEVNHELASLTLGLQAAIRILRPGGRLGVVSFHSLEDTIVKNALHVSAQNCLCPPQQTHCTCAHRASLLLLSRKAIKADAAELASNPRARSARLRVAEKLDDVR
ncbi:MAG: 16S rRNA (cytosine(1402)-N(4))-methyltransferase RsmH [Candidatus Dormibacteraeota bacterium]|uniref:Ribosomal RNA small subunit methyltransferase H n=3 Tax=Candidatus Aeolococcus gillhamiae TaxID=3127015 RepID=A0A934K3R1_9BACT|nr:16S rRNA (cytosine(1402)-N(4))-methyltransferase RsmH [Candidatus Dormibacteraeota bacterium]